MERILTRDYVLDMCDAGRSGWEVLVDPRFRLTAFRRSVRDGRLEAYLDFKATRGQRGTVCIQLDEEQMAILSQGQVVEYIRMQIELANDDLVGFIESGQP